MRLQNLAVQSEPARDDEEFQPVRIRDGDGRGLFPVLEPYLFVAIVEEDGGRACAFSRLDIRAFARLVHDLRLAALAILPDGLGSAADQTR